MFSEILHKNCINYKKIGLFSENKITAAWKNIANINSENEDLVESEKKLEAQKQE